MPSRRTIAAALLTAAAATFAPAAAAAQASPPAHTPNGQTVELVCDELGTLTAQYFTRGEWFHAAEPRLIVDSSQVLIAYAFDYQYTPKSGSQIDLEGAKPAPKHDRLDRCEMSIPDDEGVFVATYWVSYTPK